jgi:hypothetical protein
MESTASAIVVFEIDRYYIPGNFLEKLRACQKQVVEVVRDSGLSGRAIDPTIASSATLQDAEYFKANPHRSHHAREAIQGEKALNGRPQESCFVVIKQARPGARLLLAVPFKSLATSEPNDATLHRKIMREGVLELLFNAATRNPGRTFDFDAIVTRADLIESQAATADGLKRRLS